METGANGDESANQPLPRRFDLRVRIASSPDAAQKTTDKKKKTEYLRQYRAAIKADPTAYVAHRKAETARIKAVRERQTEEQRERNRVLQRERQKKYRERQKAKKDEVPSRTTRLSKKEREALREKGRTAAQKYRDKLTPQKRCAINKKRMQRYWSKKAESTATLAPTTSTSRRRYEQPLDEPATLPQQPVDNSAILPFQSVNLLATLPQVCSAAPLQVNAGPPQQGDATASLQLDRASPLQVDIASPLPQEGMASPQTQEDVTSPLPQEDMVALQTQEASSPTQPTYTCTQSVMVTSPPPQQACTSEPQQDHHPYPSRGALRAAVSRIKRGITKNKLATVIKQLISTADNDTKETLRNANVCISPMSAKLKKPIKLYLDKLKKKRDKTSIMVRRDIMAALPSGVSSGLGLKNPIQTSHELYKQGSSKKKLFVQEHLETLSTHLPTQSTVSKRTGVQKKILSESISSIHKKTLSNRTTVSLRSLYRHKPDHILTSRKVKFRQCLCDVCFNCVSMCKSLNKSIKVFKTLDDWINDTMCDTESQKIDCVRRECSLCGCDRVKQKLYESLDSACMDEEVRFVLWENVTMNGKKKMCKVTKQLKVSCLIESFFSRLQTIALHRYTDRWQRSQYKKLKNDLPLNTCLFVLDFAENYTCKAQDEAQSAYWSNAQVTVHPIVSFVRCAECNETCTHNLVFLTDDMKHDSHAVQTFFLKAKEYICSFTNINKLFIISDGAAAHYKSKVPFFYLSKLNIAAEKIFFGARHGKSECDALGGTVKSLATTLVASNTEVIIDSARSLFEECSSRFSMSQTGNCGNVHKSRTFFLVDPSEIVREEHADLKTIPQTRSLHHIKKVRPNVLAVRKLSCFCKSCLDGSGMCENIEWVGEWEFVKLANIDECQNEASEAEHVDNEDSLRVGAFHIVMWNGKDYVAQIMAVDGNWVHLNFMKWHVGKLCWGEEDLSWEESDIVGCEVELKLDEIRSNQRKQYFTYTLKMPKLLER